MAEGPPPLPPDLPSDGLLASLVESEQYGPAFRAVFEADESSGPQAPGKSNRGEKEVVDTLSKMVNRKQKDIKDICHQHYQEFVESVDELLSLRVDTSLLKQDAITLNEQLQKSGRLVLDKVLFILFPPKPQIHSLKRPSINTKTVRNTV